MTNDVSNRPDVVIAVSGGVVTAVFTDLRELKISVVDWDDFNAEGESHPGKFFTHDRLESMPDELRQVSMNGAMKMV